MNQPTAQFYHVITDDRFPVLGLRRAAGQSTVAIASRGCGDGIAENDWYTRRRRERLDRAEPDDRTSSTRG